MDISAGLLQQKAPIMGVAVVLAVLLLVIRLRGGLLVVSVVRVLVLLLSPSKLSLVVRVVVILPPVAVVQL